MLIIYLTIPFCELFCSFGRDINQGNKFFKKRKYDEAIEKYNSAEIKKPSSPLVFYNKGNTFYKQQSYEQAIREYQKSLGLTKDKELKSKLLFNMGNAYLKLGDINKAKEAYISALKLNPKDEDIKYNLQYALVELNSPQGQNKQQNRQDKKTGNEQKSQQEKQQKNKYMSEQDVQRLVEMVSQQGKDKLKEALKPQKPQLPPVDKDW
ncbi:MAG: tetratricopeptide repeat protein [Endomicrobia bacterium]|nr:tetratricopeptide repeat protein [Endomicrobiia bacterium]